MVQRIIIAIDPGSASGFICLLIIMEDGSYDVVLISFKDKNPYQWSTELEKYILPFYGVANIEGIAEQVGFMPRQGKGAWSMYKNIGHIEMWFVLRRIPVEFVSAQSWQKFFIKKAGTKKFTDGMINRIVLEMQKANVCEEDINAYLKKKKEEVDEINLQNKQKKKLHRGRMRLKAAQLFPMVNVTDDNSQALLIAWSKFKEGKLVKVEEGETTTE